MTRNALLLIVALAFFVAAGMSSSFATQSAPVVNKQVEERIDLNQATVEELVELPGIGKKVAERIIAYRQKNGSFSNVEELMNVKGIGEKTLLRLRPRLYVGASRKR